MRSSATSPNQFAVIIVDESTGERIVLWDRDERLALRPREIPVDAIRAARLVHVDDVDQGAAIDAARVAREAGVRVTSDIDRLTDRTEELVAAVTIPIFAEHVPLALTGQSDAGVGAARAAQAPRRPALRHARRPGGAVRSTATVPCTRRASPSMPWTRPAPATSFAAASSTRRFRGGRSSTCCDSRMPRRRSAARVSARWPASPAWPTSRHSWRTPHPDDNYQRPATSDQRPRPKTKDRRPKTEDRRLQTDPDCGLPAAGPGPPPCFRKPCSSPDLKVRPTDEGYLSPAYRRGIPSNPVGRGFSPAVMTEDRRPIPDCRLRAAGCGPWQESFTSPVARSP